MSEMRVDYVDHMGTDLSVVNAARVSFHKVSDEFVEKDEKLISYLARNGHWTPFGHTSISLRVKAPIFVARQLAKHQVGGVWNEVSRRYVDDEPEFWLPKLLRYRAENIKQGSSDEVTDMFAASLEDTTRQLLQFYKNMIEEGIAPELARMVLPQSMMTEWVWTGSVAFFARVCKLRLDSHSQQETQWIAELIASHCEESFPVSWRALIGPNT